MSGSVDDSLSVGKTPELVKWSLELSELRVFAWHEMSSNDFIPLLNITGGGGGGVGKKTTQNKATATCCTIP